MKRIFALLLILILSINLLAGCKAVDSEEEFIANLPQNNSSLQNAPQDQNSSDPNGDGTANQSDDDADLPSNDAQSSDEHSQKPGENTQPSDDNKKPSIDQNPSAEQPPAEEQAPSEEQPPVEENDPYAAMIADQSGTKIKLLSQNLRGDSATEQGTDNDVRIRRYRLQTLIEKYDPDVISAQEFGGIWVDIFQQDYSAKYDMFYTYQNVKGDAVNPNPILWKKDKYTKLEDGYFWLSRTPNEGSYSYEIANGMRMVNWVKLIDNSTGSKFYIFSTHFGFYSEMSSIEGLRQQILNAFKMASKDEYAFCLGDLNFYYQTSQYDVFCNGINMIDLRVIAEDMARDEHCELNEIRVGSHNGFQYEDGNCVIDYIMTTPRKHQAIDRFGYIYDKLGNEAYGINPGWVSDHFAVLAEIRIDTELDYGDYFGKYAK